LPFHVQEEWDTLLFAETGPRIAEEKPRCIPGRSCFGQRIIVNAIAVDLDIDLPGVKGFIDIGQLKASISEAAVPEPSTRAIMALGFVVWVRLSARPEGRDDRLSVKG
jgi:hypothetical protein